ncbi:MAG: hypothetical protein GF330_00420 [Candidatus Eisenbacteria bacterium]|nr:hypothetical protein [Candidatus Eisenbacteria bacterium]
MRRRDFVRRALALTAAGLIVPPWLRRSFVPAPLAARATDGRFEHPPLAGRVLVQVNLSGGNDGLSSFVPITDATYYEVRSTIAIPPEETVPISSDTGLHPELAPLADLYDAGRMALLHGVGYPQMNLSHFRSTDIWFSASASDQYISTGWIARFIEAMFPFFPHILPDAP